MGVDLADTRLRRLQVERDRLTRIIEVLEAHTGNSQLAEDTLARLDVLQGARTPQAMRAADTDSVILTLGKIHTYTGVTTANPNPDAAQVAIEKGAAARLLHEIVGYFAVVRRADSARLDEILMNLELDHIKQDQSIRLSAINAAEREAIIGRQLDAMRVYYEGGLTPEQIGNILGLAQVAAQGIIAGKVN